MCIPQSFILLNFPQMHKHSLFAFYSIFHLQTNDSVISVYYFCIHTIYMVSFLTGAIHYISARNVQGSQAVVCGNPNALGGSKTSINLRVPPNSLATLNMVVAAHDNNRMIKSQNNDIVLILLCSFSHGRPNCISNLRKI